MEVREESLEGPQQETRKSKLLFLFNLFVTSFLLTGVMGWAQFGRDIWKSIESALLVSMVAGALWLLVKKFFPGNRHIGMLLTMTVVIGFCALAVIFQLLRAARM